MGGGLLAFKFILIFIFNFLGERAELSTVVDFLFLIFWRRPLVNLLLLYIFLFIFIYLLKEVIDFF